MRRLTEREIVDQAQAWARTGAKVAVVTVVAAWGAVPRTGAHMAVHESGAFVGSISEGFAEGAVIADALRALAEGKPRLVSLPMGPAGAFDADFEMPGEIQVFIAPIPPIAPITTV